MKSPATSKGKGKKEINRKKQALDKVHDREAAKAKATELLEKPLSAFVLFGFAQRNLLKRQKPGATVKEIVKAAKALLRSPPRVLLRRRNFAQHPLPFT